MKRHELPLEQKISLINDNDRGNGFLILKLAEKYEISKSSVANILICNADYQNDYLSNVNKGIKRKLKDESGKHIDEVLFEWFTAQCAKHIPISSPALQEKAREIVEDMGNLSGEFRASNERGFGGFIIGTRSDSDKFCVKVQVSSQPPQMNGNIAFRQPLIRTTATTCTMRMKQHSYLNQYRIDHSFSAKRTENEVSIQKNDIPFCFVRTAVDLTSSSP